MTTRNLLRFLSVCIVAAFAGTAAADQASHDVLSHWIGEWTGGVAGAANEIVQSPTQCEAHWALDNHYVQGTNSDATGKPLGIWMLRHDDRSGKFQVWYFAGDGVHQWDGTWSAADTTMNWSGDDGPTGAKVSGYTRFEGHDKQSWQLNFDKDGKVTTDTGSLQRK
jgi:hypothetical protein